MRRAPAGGIGREDLQRFGERLLSGRAAHPDQLVAAEQADGIDLVKHATGALQRSCVQLDDGEGIIEGDAEAAGELGRAFRDEAAIGTVEQE